MTDETKLRLKMRIGGVFMIVGGILQIAYRPIGTNVVGLVLMGIGMLLMRRPAEELRRIKGPVAPDQKRKQFVVLAIVATLASAAVPVMAHWDKPQEDVWTYIVVGACLWPVSIGYFHWYTFTRRDQTQPPRADDVPSSDPRG